MLKNVAVAVIALLVSVVSGVLLNSDRIFAVLQPITVCLSIMAAAVFVRLNRGMPSLDWKTIPPVDRKNLTKEIENLSLEYVGVLIVASVSIVLLLLIAGVGAEDWPSLNSWLSRIVSGAFTFSLLWTIWRMAYVVWRDYDIVKLQKRLIDDEADRQIHAEEVAESDKKIERIKEAQLRAPSLPPVKQWDE